MIVHFIPDLHNYKAMIIHFTPDLHNYKAMIIHFIPDLRNYKAMIVHFTPDLHNYKAMIIHFTPDHHFSSLHFTSLLLHFTSLPFTPLHFTSLLLISHHFTSLHFSFPHFTSLHITSLHFTTHHSPIFTFLHFWMFRHHVSKTLHFTSLIITFLTPSLKICDVQGKVASASEGSRFHNLLVLFTKQYLPMCVLCFLALNLRS